jgi:hypothetical protein
MWNHYRWIIGNTHREGERDITEWGEREREETEGGGIALVLSRIVIFGSDR